jgi:hypothetical protein
MSIIMCCELIPSTGAPKTRDEIKLERNKKKKTGREIMRTGCKMSALSITGVALENEREKGDESNSDNIEWLNA